MKAWWLLLGACSASSPKPAAPDASPDAPGFPAPLAPGDFAQPLDKAHIRALQTWLDDATFDVKWTGMLATPIDFLGGADSAFHADLPVLPGGLVLCHGDAKLDNFGWTLVDTTAVFSDNDFDDAGRCPAAADALHFLVSTDLFYGDAALDAAALSAYIDTLRSATATIAVDPTTQPAWDTLRSDGVDQATHSDSLALGGEVQAATSDEATALRALAAADPRFPTSVLDVARDVKTTGGSAGMRRFWLLVEDATHPRTILELKELGTPGTEFGPHDLTYDGPDRFDVLKPFWWDVAAPHDHFSVDVLGGRFVVRDKFRRANPKPDALTQAQRLDMLAAEASLLANRHRDAWAGVDPDVVAGWLRESSVTLVARWRAAFLGG